VVEIFKKLSIMKIFLCIVSLLLFGEAYSQNIYYVNVLQSDNTGNGLSWSAAFKDLQHAINQASAGDEVWVAKGTYLPTEFLPGASGSNPRDKSFFLDKNIKIYGGFHGDESSMSDRNISLNPSKLSADFNQDDNLHGELDSLLFDGYDENAYHVMVTSKLPITAEINGFTIVNGNANGSGLIQNGSQTYPKTQGGGLYNFESKPLVKHVTFSENRAILDGGAVYDKTCSGIVFDSCHFEYNLAYSRITETDIQSTSNESLQIDLYENHTANAGGIYHYIGALTIDHSKFLNNHAVSIVKLNSIASVLLSQNGLEEQSKTSGEANVIANGGAIYTSGATATITNTHFELNSAKSEVNLNAKSTLETSSGFSPDGEAISYIDGSASSYGGACAFNNLGNSELSNCIFIENNASSLAHGSCNSINDTYSGSLYYPDADGTILAFATGGTLQAYSIAKFAMNKCFFYQNKAKSIAHQFTYATNSGSEIPSVDADAQSSSIAGAID
jgi:predicted outer membrane repeat protein